jgi:hypothetical protein
LQEQREQIKRLEVELMRQHDEKLSLATRLATIERDSARTERRLSRASLLKMAAAGVAAVAGAGMLGTQGAPTSAVVHADDQETEDNGDEDEDTDCDVDEDEYPQLTQPVLTQCVVSQPIGGHGKHQNFKS